MCGIAGTFAYGPGGVADPAEADRMSARLACRGPDAAASWRSDDGKVALAHRRLAIIDLTERGAQPMKRDDHSAIITYNGEIYNYRALRKSLEGRGHRFASDSDTEVLLRLYGERGERMVDELVGMFAFAIWDAARGRLFLARDHFGIKPLYYANVGAQFRFASEVKALVDGAALSTTPDAAGHAGFFLFGSVPEPFTMHRQVRQLPAGATMWVDGAGPTAARTYASISDLIREAESGRPKFAAGEVSERFRTAARETVRRHLVADVDVGVFLSSGIDSTTVAALAAEAEGSLRTVTLGFEEYRGTPADETPLAEAVARQYGADHRTVWVTREDFIAESGRFFDRMDQPSNDGVNSYFVSRAAASTGLKVALSGLGGDELFAGYPSFRELPRLVRSLRIIPGAPAVGRAARLVLGGAMTTAFSPKYASLLEYGSRWPTAYLLRRGLFMPWELPSVMDPAMAREGLAELDIEQRLAQTIEGITTPRLRVSALEATWYMRNQLLRDTDWASMSSSLEVRVPLVDWQFWREVIPLIASDPSAITKSDFARTPAKPLPSAVFTRPKTGFTTPLHTWMQSPGAPRFRGRGSRGWARQAYRTSGRVTPVPDRAPASQLRVMGWPAFTITQNPYNLQLYRSLRELGVAVSDHSPGNVFFGDYDVVHVHWPNFNWPPRRHSLVARLRLITHAFAVPAALIVARLRNKRIVWTIHNLKSHDTRFPGLARIYDRLIVRLIDGHISLSPSAREEAEAVFPHLRSLPGFVIPHGHYRDAYAPRVDAAAARARLGIPPDARVVIAFGGIRPYKNARMLFSLFDQSTPRDRLIIAGRPFDHSERDAARDAAARNDRVHAILDFVPDDEVHVMFSAATLFVTLADDALNSGSMILALSLGIPVLARDHGPTRDLQALFGPDLVQLYTGQPTWETIAAALDRAERQGRMCLPVDALARLDWPPIARQTIEAFGAVRDQNL